MPFAGRDQEIARERIGFLFLLGLQAILAEDVEKCERLAMLEQMSGFVEKGEP